MKGIFTAIKDFFATIIGIITFAFKGIIMLVNLLVQGMRILLNIITILPTPLLVGAAALIVICVLYKVLGRESNG